MVLGDQLAEGVVGVLNLIDDAARAHRRIVVAGKLLQQPTDLVGSADASDALVHSSPKGRHPVMAQPAQLVVFNRMDRAQLIGLLSDLSQAVVLELHLIGPGGIGIARVGEDLATQQVVGGDV